MADDRLFTVFPAVAVVVLLARALTGRLRMPDAILLVVLGVAAGFVPALPAVVLAALVVLVTLVGQAPLLPVPLPPTCSARGGRVSARSGGRRPRGSRRRCAGRAS